MASVLVTGMRVALVLLLLGTLLAGCTSSEPAPSVVESEEQVEATQGLGSLEIQILGKAFQPLVVREDRAPAGTILMQETGVRYQTDFEGTLRINDLEPGRYTLEMDIPDYEGFTYPVTILADQVFAQVWVLRESNEDLIDYEYDEGTTIQDCVVTTPTTELACGAEYVELLLTPYPDRSFYAIVIQYESSHDALFEAQALCGSEVCGQTLLDAGSEGCTWMTLDDGPLRDGGAWSSEQTLDAVAFRYQGSPVAGDLGLSAGAGVQVQSTLYIQRYFDLPGVERQTSFC